MPLVTCEAPVLSNAEICAAVLETNFAEIPAGINSNSNCFLVSAGERFTATQNFLTRPDKNPVLSKTVGTPGRREARWSISKTLAGSGTAGVVGDDDMLWHAAFGKAAAITASTEVQYDLEDASPSLSIGSWYTPTAAKADEIAYGSVVDEVVLSFGGDFTTVTFSGPCFWVTSEGQVLDGAVPALAKGTLVAWPAKPTAPVYVGDPVSGQSGNISIDSVVYSSIQNATLRIKFNRVMPNNTWNQQFPGCPRQGIREVSLEWRQDVYQSSDVSTLLGKISRGETVPIILTSGNVAGNTHKFTLPKCQVSKPTREDGGDVLVYSFNAQGVATTPTAKDEIKYEIV